MPKQMFFLTEEDVATLKQLVGAWESGLLRPLRASEANVEVADFPSTAGIYVARTPSGGIPALVEESGAGIKDTPGNAFCDVYRITEADEKLRPVTGLKHRVWNLSSSAVPGNSWVKVDREAFGMWIATPTAVSSGGSVFSGVKAVRTSNLSVANTTATDVTWNGEIYDTDSYITPSSTTLTLPSTNSPYLIVVNILFTPAFGNGAGGRRTILYAGTNVLAYQIGPANVNVGGSTGTGHNIVFVYYPTNVTDLIKVEVYHDHGSSINVFAGSNITITKLD